MAENDWKSRFAGKGVSRTIIQLVVASVIVGAIFTFLGLSPAEFWRGIFDAVSGLVRRLGDNISEIILNLGTYLLIGAAIVVPIWLITRLMSGRK